MINEDIVRISQMSELCSNSDGTVIRRGVFRARSYNRKSKPLKKISESCSFNGSDPLLEHAPLAMAEPKFFRDLA